MNHLECETNMISIGDLRALIDSMLLTKTDSMPISDVTSKLASLRMARSKNSAKTSDDLDSFSSSESHHKKGDRPTTIDASFCGPGVYFSDGKYRIQTSRTPGDTDFEIHGTTHEYDSNSGITTKNQGSELDVNESFDRAERGSLNVANISNPSEEASASQKKINGLRKSNLRRPSLPSTSSFYRNIVSGMFRTSIESVPSAHPSIPEVDHTTSRSTERLTDNADISQPTAENQYTSTSDSSTIPNKSHSSLSRSSEQNIISEHPNVEVSNQVRPHSPGRPELYPPSLQSNNATYIEESDADIMEKENVYLRAEKFRHFAEREKRFQTSSTDDIMSDSDESANYENAIPEYSNTTQSVLPDDDDVPPLWWGSIKDEHEHDLTDMHNSPDCNSNDSSKNKRHEMNDDLPTTSTSTTSKHTNDKYVSSKNINNIKYINGDRTQAPTATDVSTTSDIRDIGAIESDDDSSEFNEQNTHDLGISSSRAGGDMKSNVAKVGDTYVPTDLGPDFGSDPGLGSMNSVYGNRKSSYTSSHNPRGNRGGDRGERGGESVFDENVENDKTHTSIYDVSDIDDDNRFDNSFERTMKETDKMLQKEEDESICNMSQRIDDDQLEVEVEVEVGELSFVRESPAKRNGRAALYDSSSLNIDIPLSSNTIYGKSHNSKFRNCGTSSSQGDQSG